ncbi:MAG: hypothetical protein CM15mP89_5220 [Gammaproteobacteria bacterium]|nr:MAG: hypothetical protein CM15mP89_5220 [Gammaproteobacteria bacterium]
MAPGVCTGVVMVTGGAGVGAHGLKVDSFLLLAGVYTTAPLLTILRRPTAATECGGSYVLSGGATLLVAQTALGESIDTATTTSFALVWMGGLLVFRKGFSPFSEASSTEICCVRGLSLLESEFEQPYMSQLFFCAAKKPLARPNPGGSFCGFGGPPRRRARWCWGKTLPRSGPSSRPEFSERSPGIPPLSEHIP